MSIDLVASGAFIITVIILEIIIFACMLIPNWLAGLIVMMPGIGFVFSIYYGFTASDKSAIASPTLVGVIVFYVSIAAYYHKALHTKMREKRAMRKNDQS